MGVLSNSRGPLGCAVVWGGSAKCAVYGSCPRGPLMSWQAFQPKNANEQTGGLSRRREGSNGARPSAKNIETVRYYLGTAWGLFTALGHWEGFWSRGQACTGPAPSGARRSKTRGRPWPPTRRSWRSSGGVSGLGWDGVGETEKPEEATGGPFSASLGFFSASPSLLRRSPRLEATGSPEGHVESAWRSTFRLAAHPKLRRQPRQKKACDVVVPLCHLYEPQDS